MNARTCDASDGRGPAVPASAGHESAVPLAGLVGYVRWTVLSFVWISLLVTLATGLSANAPPPLAIRAGILADLLAERPIGRQALCSSVWVMPLPTLAAIPFALPLRPTSYPLAHLYGLACVAAMAAVPLASLLARARWPGPYASATAFLAAVSSACVSVGWVDLPIAVALGIMALSLDRSPKPVLRAASGTFYALLFLTHPAGALCAGARLAILAASSWTAHRADAERRAVNWIRASQILYGAAVYLLMDWTIMGTPIYSIRRARLPPPCRIRPHAMAELAATLKEKFADCAPVSSGHWGYMAQPILTAFGGHHFIDFHPERMPAWERRDVLLVVPTGANPLSALSDLDPRLRTRAADRLRGALLLAQTDQWMFFLVAAANGTPSRSPPAGNHRG